MLTKRIATRLGLLNFAFAVALAGLIVAAGVPPARFPLKFRIMSGVILVCFLLSLLYQWMAQLPPIRRVKTIMILVAVVAMELSYCLMLTEMLGL